jgi:hypothetical protein
MINKWFNQELTVKRDSWITDDDGNKLYTKEEDKGTISGDIQQASPEFAEAMQMDFRKTYILYTGIDEDIQEGDKIDNYTVKGLQRFTHPRMKNDHIKAILQR